MARTSLQKHIETLVEKEINRIEKNYIGRVSRKFSEDSRPDYERLEYYKAQDYVYTLFTFKTPWVFISGGAPKGGRVKFTDDFRPQTKPRVLSVGAKKGRVVRRGSRAPKKKPIQAREFEQKAAELRQPIFEKNFQNLLNKRVPQEIVDRVKGVRTVTLKL